MLLPFRGPSKTQQTGKEHAGRTALKLALTSDAPRPGPSGPRKEGTPAAPGNLDPALPSSPRQQGTQDLKKALFNTNWMEFDIPFSH